MTDGAGLERELGEFFGELRAAVEAGEERRLGREAGIQQELTEFLAGLPSEVNVEEERRRALDPGLQRELGEFFGGLSPVVRAEEERQRRAAGDLERNLTGMFGLLEPTIAAATVAIRVMEERAREEQDRRTGRRFSAFDLVRTQELDLSRIFRGLLDPSGDHSQGICSCRCCSKNSLWRPGMPPNYCAASSHRQTAGRTWNTRLATRLFCPDSRLRGALTLSLSWKTTSGSESKTSLRLWTSPGKWTGTCLPWRTKSNNAVEVKSR